MEHQEYLNHFPKELSADIKQYATDDVFKNSRYIFYSRSGKHQKGYCTHCRTEFQADYLKHNTMDVCPCCKSECKAKSSGMGRNSLFNDAYFIYYEKSIVNPEVITARGIYASRDYREDYHNIETKYSVIAMYVFEMGNSAMLLNNTEYSWCYGLIGSSGVKKTEKIYSLSDKFQSVRSAYCLESIKETIKNTPFQYSCYEKYIAGAGDMVIFFGLYANYPCIEYLTKLGMRDVVEAKLFNRPTYSAINWRGKNLQKVLKISKKEINEIKAANISVNPLFLRLLQMSNKDNLNLAINEIGSISRKYDCYFKDLQKALQYANLRKINNYINKQFISKNEDNDQRKYWYRERETLAAWNDYIGDCNSLGLDLNQECILLPGNLYSAHQNTIKQVKFKEDKELSEKIAMRIKALKRYCFEYLGFIIRPALGAKELIEEGKALNHCVGGYADRYAKGETNIFVLRKASDPDTPYFTVEIKEKRITQCRGNKNCQPDEKVSAFIDAFKEQKLINKNVKVAV